MEETVDKLVSKVEWALVKVHKVADHIQSVSSKHESLLYSVVLFDCAFKVSVLVLLCSMYVELMNKR